jgi:hypothetical protein
MLLIKYPYCDRFYCPSGKARENCSWPGESYAPSFSFVHQGGDKEPTQAYFKYVKESDEETTMMGEGKRRGRSKSHLARISGREGVAPAA